MEEIIATQALDADMKVFSHLVYEYEKGVRNLVLYTISEEYTPLALGKLSHREIEYFVQPVPNKSCVNIFSGAANASKPSRSSYANAPSIVSPRRKILSWVLYWDTIFAANASGIAREWNTPRACEKRTNNLCSCTQTFERRDC